MNKLNLLKILPTSINVKVFKGKSGRLIAELPEYDIFTEVDEGMAELLWGVNDLIFTFFDVPKKYHGNICYHPREKPKELLNEEKPQPFKRYLDDSFIKNVCFQ